MSEKIIQLQELIDDIKETIPEQKYLELCSKLKELYIVKSRTVSYSDSRSNYYRCPISLCGIYGPDIDSDSES